VEWYNDDGNLAAVEWYNDDGNLAAVEWFDAGDNHDPVGGYNEQAG
jgi:hypothetical protein